MTPPLTPVSMRLSCAQVGEEIVLSTVTTFMLAITQIYHVPMGTVLLTVTIGTPVYI